MLIRTLIMAKKKILVTVKTYPTISKKYDELVCTAGFDEDGKWIRIYPVPFRKLDYVHRYKKYQWIEMDLIRNKSDFRPESYSPRNIDAADVITFHDKLGTEENWAERKKFILRNIYDDMSALISEAKTKGLYTSLAVFKPAEIIDFVCKPVEKEWSEKQKATLEQERLFDKKSTHEIVKKLPYKFSYTFCDVNGNESTLMNEDWEIGALFWNCLEKNRGDEHAACKDVRNKYWDDFAKTKDLYFFLGTTKLNQLRAPNPFIIIGTFHHLNRPGMGTSIISQKRSF